MHRTHTRSAGFALSLLLAAGCSKSSNNAAPVVGETPSPDENVPAEYAVGERLFHETRFAQFFAVRAGFDLNAPLGFGDPVLDNLALHGSSQPSPFAGSTQSCAACHLTDQAAELPGAGVRALNDFAARVRFSERADGARLAARNVPSLIDAGLATGRLFHADGEFTSLDEALGAALLGRKLGWLADERGSAVRQVAEVIRRDDGMGALAADYGSVSYADLLDSAVQDVPAAFRLPEEFRLDLAAASDEDLVDAVVALIGAYLDEQGFARSLTGAHSGSPYDAFLAANDLPNLPASGESDLDYSRRLRAELDALTAPLFVDEPSLALETHDQAFSFGPLELDGLRLFLAEPGSTGSVGNCVACHAAPNFTDELFHNTGVSQAEYDGVHGDGSFMQLVLPDLAARNLRPGLYLPASATRPTASSVNRHRVLSGWPDLVDLGLWNVFANPSMPNPQPAIREVLVEVYGASVTAMADADLLPLTEAMFRTPSLRDLGHSAPYGHDGAYPQLETMLAHYASTSELARQGFVRNADPRLFAIELTPADLPALDAFLRALNEDLE